MCWRSWRSVSRVLADDLTGGALTWFSHGSGAILGFRAFGRMRRGRDPSRTPSRPRRPVWDNRRGQLPGTGIRSDGENLYGENRYGSAPGVSGTSSGGVAVTWDSLSEGFSSSTFQSFCGSYRLTWSSRTVWISVQYMGASEFLNRRLNEVGKATLCFSFDPLCPVSTRLSTAALSTHCCGQRHQIREATVGGLGSEGDKTVLLGPKNWNPISSSKCTVLARMAKLLQITVQYQAGSWNWSCNIRMQQKGVRKQRLSNSCLKTGAGKAERLSNSCLKTGAGKAEVEQ